MRLVYFFICTLFLQFASGFSVSAQTASYDTLPYIHEYHQKRLDSFSTEPMTKGKILFLGNSITEFGDWKSLFQDPTIINRGIAGDITYGVLARLDETITHQPSKLFLEIGINDLSKGIPDEIVVKNILRIIRRVKAGSPATMIYVQSLLPTNDSAKNDYPEVWGKNDHVVTVNKQLKMLAQNNGYTYIDLYTAFKGSDGKLKAQYTTDGLHPNDAGYKVWADLLKKGKYL